MNGSELARALADDANSAGVDYSRTFEKMLDLAEEDQGVELVCEIAASSLALLISTAQDFEDYQEEVAGAFEQLEQAALAAGVDPWSERRKRQAREEEFARQGPPDVPMRLIP